MKKVVTAALEESVCRYVTPDIAKECAGTLGKGALESYVNIDLCEELVDKTMCTEQKISCFSFFFTPQNLEIGEKSKVVGINNKHCEKAINSD